MHNQRARLGVSDAYSEFSASADFDSIFSEPNPFDKPSGSLVLSRHGKQRRRSGIFNEGIQPGMSHIGCTHSLIVEFAEDVRAAQTDRIALNHQVLSNIGAPVAARPGDVMDSPELGDSREFPNASSALKRWAFWCRPARPDSAPPIRNFSFWQKPHICQRKAKYGPRGIWATGWASPEFWVGPHGSVCQSVKEFSPKCRIQGGEVESRP